MRLDEAPEPRDSVGDESGGIVGGKDEGRDGIGLLGLESGFTSIQHVSG